MPFLTGDELLASKDEVEYWARPLLTKHPLGVTLLAAPRKSMKSYLSLHLAEAIATGSDFLGWPTQKARVLYIDWENGLAEMKSRYEPIRKHYNKDRVIQFWEPDNKPLSLDSWKEGRHELDEHLKKHPVDVIFFDTLRKATGADENSSTEMVKVFNSLSNLQNTHNVSVVLIHHMGKLGQFRGPHSLDSVRGSSLILDHPNTIGVLDKNPDRPEIDIHWWFRNHAQIDPWEIKFDPKIGLFVPREEPVMVPPRTEKVEDIAKRIKTKEPRGSV